MKHILFVAIMLFGAMLHGQKITIDHPPLTKISIKETGVFKEYIGAIDDRIFSYNGDPLRGKKKYAKVVVHDKKTMKLLASLSIYGAGSPRQAFLADLEYEDVYIVGEQVWILWEKKGKKDGAILLEKLDKNFKQVEKPTEIVDLTPIIKDKDQKLLGYRFIQNSENSLQIGLVAEVSTGKDKPIDLIVLGEKNFKTKKYKRLTLNGTNAGDLGRFLNGTYTLLPNGDLYGSYYIQEGKGKDKESYFLVCGYDSAEDELITEKIDHPKKSLGNVVILQKNNVTTMMGTYFENGLLEGIYSVNVNSRSKKFENFQLNPFSSAQLDDIYQRNSENKAKTKVAVKKAKKGDNDSNKEVIQGTPVLESYSMNDKGEIIAAISMMYNYTVRVCSGSGTTQTCRDVPYCRKTDVITVKMNKDNKILWANTIRRSITYSGFNHYDVEVVEKNDNYYLFYGNNKLQALNATAISKSDRKTQAKEAKANMKADEAKGIKTMEYGFYTGDAGDGGEKTATIKQPGTGSKNNMGVDPELMKVMNGDIYTYQINRKGKTYYGAPVRVNL